MLFLFIIEIYSYIAIDIGIDISIDSDIMPVPGELTEFCTFNLLMLRKRTTTCK